MGSDLVELARLLALVNVAMADAAIAIWESKYHYELWRPVSGIREDDGNPATLADPTFTPLGAPASNLVGPNFTPPFPAYPSGHAGFGGALFQTLRRFYGTDDIAFTFVSDEFNGVTQDHDGNVRPRIVRAVPHAVRGGGGERPEPDLPRHPLGVRQDRRHRAGPPRGGPRVRPRVPAVALTACAGRAGGLPSRTEPSRPSV